MADRQRERITRIEAKIDKKVAKIDKLEDELSEFRTDKRRIRAKHDTNSSDHTAVSNIEENIKEAEREVATLNVEVARLKIEAKRLKIEAKTEEIKILQLKRGVKSYEHLIDTWELTKLEVDLAEVEVELASLEHKKALHDLKLQPTNEALKELCDHYKGDLEHKKTKRDKAQQENDQANPRSHVHIVPRSGREEVPPSSTQQHEIRPHLEQQLHQHSSGANQPAQDTDTAPNLYGIVDASYGHERTHPENIMAATAGPQDNVGESATQPCGASSGREECHPTPNQQPQPHDAGPQHENRQFDFVDQPRHGHQHSKHARQDGVELIPPAWMAPGAFISECFKKGLDVRCYKCQDSALRTSDSSLGLKLSDAKNVCCRKKNCKKHCEKDFEKEEPIDGTHAKEEPKTKIYVKKEIRVATCDTWYLDGYLWPEGVLYEEISHNNDETSVEVFLPVRFGFVATTKKEGKSSRSPRFSQKDLEKALTDLEEIEKFSETPALPDLEEIEKHSVMFVESFLAPSTVPNVALSAHQGCTRLITSQRIEELPSIWRTAKVESMGDLGKPVDIKLDGRTELARARLQWLIVRDEGEILSENIAFILEDLKCLIRDDSGCWERDVDGKYVGWCLPMACKLRRTNIISTLLQLAPIHDVKTGLHFAISSSVFETVTLILQYGVDRQLFAPLDLEYALVIAFREGWRLPLDVKQLLLHTKKENGEMSLREEFGKFYLKRDVASLCEAIIHRQFYRAACICLLGVVRLSPTTSNFPDDMVEYLRVRSKIVLISLLSQLGGHTVTAARNQNPVVVALRREIRREKNDANYDPKGFIWRICKLRVTGLAMTIAYNGVNAGKRQRDTSSAKRNINNTPSRMKRRHLLPKFEGRRDTSLSTEDVGDKGKRRVIGSLPSSSKRAKITAAELSGAPDVAQIQWDKPFKVCEYGSSELFDPNVSKPFKRVKRPFQEYYAELKATRRWFRLAYKDLDNDLVEIEDDTSMDDILGVASPNSNSDLRFYLQQAPPSKFASEHVMSQRNTLVAHLRDSLRENQAEALRFAFERTARENASLMIVMPTGSGKTITMALLPFVCHLQVEEPKVLVIEPNTILRDQVSHDLRNCYGERTSKFSKDASCEERKALSAINVETLKGGLIDPNHTDVVVTNIQQLVEHSKAPNADATPGRLGVTLKPNGQRTIDSFNFSLILVDEGHHSAADMWQCTEKALKAANPDCKIVYLTATPQRGDGRTYNLQKENVYIYHRRDAERMGHIKSTTLKPTSLTSLKGTKGFDGLTRDFRRSYEYFEAMMTPAIRKLQQMRNGSKQLLRMLVTTSENKDAELCAEFFERLNRDNQFNLSAKALTGKTKAPERDDIKRMFSTGTAGDEVVDIVFQCALLGEGYDNPYISFSVFLAPPKQVQKFAQYHGRAIRMLPDCPDNLEILKMSHAYYPSLDKDLDKYTVWSAVDKVAKDYQAGEDEKTDFLFEGSHYTRYFTTLRRAHLKMASMMSEEGVKCMQENFDVYHEMYEEKRLNGNAKDWDPIPAEKVAVKVLEDLDLSHNGESCLRIIDYGCGRDGLFERKLIELLESEDSGNKTVEMWALDVTEDLPEVAGLNVQPDPHGLDGSTIVPVIKILGGDYSICHKSDQLKDQLFAFDAAVFCLSFHTGDAFEKGILSAAHMLKPGGKLYIVMDYHKFGIPHLVFGKDRADYLKEWARKFMELTKFQLEEPLERNNNESCFIYVKATMPMDVQTKDRMDHLNKHMTGVTLPDLRPSRKRRLDIADTLN